MDSVMGFLLPFGESKMAQTETQATVQRHK